MRNAPDGQWTLPCHSSFTPIPLNISDAIIWARPLSTLGEASVHTFTVCSATGAWCSAWATDPLAAIIIIAVHAELFMISFPFAPSGANGRGKLERDDNFLFA